MAAFANYQATNYDEAILGLDRFIQLHPGNPDIAYAYYLRALCYYERISDVVRDQLNTEKAEAALSEVVRRFPDTASCAGCTAEGRSDPRSPGRQGDACRPLLPDAPVTISPPSGASGASSRITRPRLTSPRRCTA